MPRRVHSQSMSPNTSLPSGSDGPTSGSKPRPREKARRRNRVIYSCLECRRRKMRCDRTDPCQNCRASQQECVYISSANEDAQFRQRLTELKEAQDAIDDTLRGGVYDRPKPPTGGSQQKRARQPEQIPTDDTDSSADDGYLEPTPLAVQDAAYTDEADDDVEDLGFRIGRMRMGERVGGFYRPKIADEILASLQQSPRKSSQSIPSPMTPGTIEELLQPGPYFTAPSINLLFSEVSSREGLMQYLPPRSIADGLLNWYWDAVHRVARVVHRPSFAQRYETLWETIETGYQPPPSLAAIVYSILFSASVAMSEEQVFELCQCSRQELKDSLQLGTELALGRAHLLRASKTETIQAFVAYLLPMCLNEISRAHSTLTGMLIRLAECIGLHRDPAEFGFSPADCQTRRLVWYQICYLDLKTSIVQGPRPFIQRHGYTTKLPLDVASLQSANNQPTWNDMILSMIRFECQEMQRQNIEFRTKLDLKKLTLTNVVSKLGAFRTEMDAKYGLYLNVASPTPMQRMASLTLKMFDGLLYVNTLSRYMTSVTYRIPDRLRQVVLIKGTEALEASVELEIAKDLQKWVWWSSSWQGYHSAFLLLFEVFNFPLRREASRIWKCLEFIFSDALVHFPPVEQKEGPLNIQKLIAYRDGKARFLLTLIAEHARAYQKAKGVKMPVLFKDSMIVVTPHKDGDDSDPRMPLNYAHEEPEGGAGSSNATGIPSSITPGRAGKQSEITQPPSKMSSEGRAGPPYEFLRTTDNTAIHSSEFSPWMQVEEGEFDGDGNLMRNTSPHAYSRNLAPNEGSSATYGETITQPKDVDPQMLEIDWTLWDRIFPPQMNDGHLDISDDGFWNIGDDLV